MSNTVGSFLNQIFYKNKKFDDYTTISQLDQWMLSSDIALSISHTIVAKDDLQIEEQSTTMPAISTIDTCNLIPPIHTFKLFQPKKEDTLFWCVYAVHHGEAGYWVIGNRYKNEEIQEKQLILEYMRENPTVVKNSSALTGKKMSQSRIQETQAELMVNKKTSWSAFFIMCLYYKINAIVIHASSNTYMEFCPAIPLSETLVETFVFTQTADGHVSVDTTSKTMAQLSTIRDTRILLDFTQERPLKAASSYKMTDLEEMAAKLGILKEDLGQKPKKADWYDAVMQKCMW